MQRHTTHSSGSSIESPSRLPLEHASRVPSLSFKNPAILTRLQTIPNWLLTSVFALAGFQVWTADTLQGHDSPQSHVYATPALIWPGHTPTAPGIEVYTHDNVILMADARPYAQTDQGQLHQFVAQRLDNTLVLSWDTPPETDLPIRWTLLIEAEHRYEFHLAPQVHHVAIPLLLWPHTATWRLRLLAETRPENPRIPTRTVWFRWNPAVDYPDPLRSQSGLPLLETPS